MHKILSITCVAALLTLTACGGTKKSSADNTVTMQPVGPAFLADSAYTFCEQQCSFGPRTMNSEAHEQCGKWIADKFRQYGMEVTLQEATLHGYDGTPLKSTNIIAKFHPERQERVMLCAHWDSRPWADNDPDEANHHTPVMAANDGASGVAVMLEVARLLENGKSSSTVPGSSDAGSAVADSLLVTLHPSLGVDFVCFDAEDWGIPQWSEIEDPGNTWALGAQYWAEQFKAQPSKPNIRYGILLDMVGGRGARFFQEGMSQLYAFDVVNRVWQAADVVGFGSFFPKEDGGRITDDHLPVNMTARIPCIDIIPYYPDCKESSFGPTWHTVKDDMEHIDRNTLQAVGQTLIQVLFSEQGTTP